MGRPKKLSFPCSYCGKEFKRKINLNKHLLCHPNFISKSRIARARSNWCPVCRKSFAESEYRLHLENEHKFDNYKIHSIIPDGENEYETKDFALNHEYRAEDFLSGESNYFTPAATNSRGVCKNVPAKLYKKRGRKPGKTFKNASSSARMKIKTEPPDMYETNGRVFESKNVTSNSPSVVTCKLCGFECKTPRGIKIHFSTIHKKKKSPHIHKILKKSPHIHKISKTATFIKQEPQDEDSDQINNHIKTSSNSQSVFTSNSVSNINQIIPAGINYNTFQIQPFFTGFANQPNIQNSFIVTNQNQQLENIPKLDYDSEKYIKWLKKFISRCKMHKYPLTPMLCQNVSHINEEITNALANPEGSLKKRSNHFYFMKIKSLLSEIMVGQLRYSMDVVKK